MNSPVLALDLATITGKGDADKATMQALGQAPANTKDAGTLVSKRAVSIAVSTGKARHER